MISSRHSMNQRPQSAEIHPGPGFRIRTDFPRLDLGLVHRLLDYDVPTVTDFLNRLFALDARIHLLTVPHHRLCGLACTVRVYPGDNLMVHKVLDVAQPGDIVVIDAHGSQGLAVNAVLGDIICTKAKHRGIAGFVVDGLVRDLPGILELDLPVFARGTTAVGPLHRGPGEVNYPIACGGTVVNPGDVIFADASGIVTVPQEVVGNLVRRLDAKRDAAARYVAAVRRGDFSNAWVDALLEANECPVETRSTPEHAEDARASLRLD
jgi:regulator of RNase E activity RraA